MVAKKVLAAVLCASMCELAVAAPLQRHVPLLLWSQHASVDDIASYPSEALDEVAVASALQRTSQSAGASMELLAVFLPDRLYTEDVANLAASDKRSSFVQDAVEHATWSAVVPHTTRAAPLTRALSSAAVPYTEVPMAKLEAFLSGSEGQNLVSNGKADVLVVRIGATDSLPALDELVQAASEVLTSATKGSVGFALTADSADVKQTAPLFGRRLAANATATATAKPAAIVCETGFLVGTSGGKAFCFSHFVHMTPEVLTGLLFGLFFIFVAYVGVSALMAIQTPTRYPLHGPPRGKEF
ncbi:hypothetical protein PybrP1_002134 [[Pythium] brassicae (nom. inval.)]|nr:hypothetical protein PybrP1_002134 [[Pythium] brassicae (nom. inval.)]